MFGNKYSIYLLHQNKKRIFLTLSKLALMAIDGGLQFEGVNAFVSKVGSID